MEITGISKIGSDGISSIIGLLEEENFNKQGWMHGIKGFSIKRDYTKNKTKVCTFLWHNGVPCDFKIVKEYKDEIIDEQEVEKVLIECGLIKRGNRK